VDVIIIFTIISFLCLPQRQKTQSIIFVLLLYLRPPIFSSSLAVGTVDTLGSRTTPFRKFFLGAYVPMYKMEVCTYVLSMTRMK